MKATRKLFAISLFVMTLSSLFLITLVPAQEIIYEGVDTQKIPDFSIYPSERYIWNISGGAGFQDEEYRIDHIIKSNRTDEFEPDFATYPVDGTSVWADRYVMNSTSSEIINLEPELQVIYWNETEDPTNFYYLPFESSAVTSDNLIDYWRDDLYNLEGPFENVQSYYNIYSFKLWNESSNNAYMFVNYSSQGILQYMEAFDVSIFMPNITLMSQPAQLQPAFSFVTASGLSTVTSTQISLDLTIPTADNNNDGLPDTDYQYRVFEDGVWSNWNVVTSFINYDLGSVPAGNYTLTVEVKNMYGITQEQIEVEYIPSSSDAIPGFSAVLILVILGFSVTILLNKYRKKM
ncbi:MAG: hypothetical protein KGD58_01560 [Candidatus Lokiarchaeota archaeon]|nr:hypothetical protein [Candidatus Lokiarchaeota archaeon]